MSVVTFLSDFGTREGFAASMKGVVLDIAPGAVVVDACHDIAPGDIVAGAWALTQYWRLYPEGTVHLAVVDPGVGSQRRPIALAAEGRYVVAPDNGLVTGVVTAARSWSCVEIAEPSYLRASVSPTFHGRDVFAPAAAHLASGVKLESLGPPLRDPVLLEVQHPTLQEAEIRGRIVHVDRFGNLITDIPSTWVDADWQFELEGKSLGGLKRTYSDVDSGEIVVVVGSMGTLEITARGASAAEKLEAARGGLVVGKRSPRRGRVGD